MSIEKPVNYTREAFLHPINLGFLFVAAFTAFFMTGSVVATQVIFSVVFGLELIYLGTLPRTAGFQKYINVRKFREKTDLFEEKRIFRELDGKSQKRFLVLKHISGLVKQNFQKMPYDSQGLLDNIINRIETLLNSYMLLLETYTRYEHYIGSSIPERLNKEIEETHKEIEESNSDKLKQVLNRRLIILKKRIDKHGAAQEKYRICISQLKTIEDTIRYIYEKSMTMNSLEELGFQLDSLLMDLEDTSDMFEGIDSDYSMSSQDELIELQNLEHETEATKTVLNRLKN
ncbi:MAG: coiled-coil domain-containing protein [Cyclonatronaceae bacterium]